MTRATPGPNRRALDDTVADLRKAGHVAAQHGALVQLALSLASAVDAEPDNASLWREYRGAVSDLLGLVRDEGDAFAALVDRLRTPLVDAKN